MKNISPYNNYKPSGIAWLGDIPKHWEVKRIKYIFKERDRRSETGLENLLSVSHYTGVTKKSDRYKEGEEISNAKTLVGYKIVTEGDLVMNIMLAWNGSLGISKYYGITSPAYCVFTSLIGGEKYFGYLFRTKEAQQEFKPQGRGGACRAWSGCRAGWFRRPRPPWHPTSPIFAPASGPGLWPLRPRCTWH